MSGVVLRCPKCGTTQGHTGECDACYDDQVRYFCSNHSPGLWLDDPVCKHCGAKFGEAQTRRPAPVPRAAPPMPPRKTPQPASMRPTPRRAESPDTSPARLPESEVAPREPSLEELLTDVLSETRERTGDRGERPWLKPMPHLRLSRPRPKGCLVKLVLLVLLLLALALGAPFILVGGLLQFLLVDLSPSSQLMAGTLERATGGIADMALRSLS